MPIQQYAEDLASGKVKPSLATAAEPATAKTDKAVKELGVGDNREYLFHDRGDVFEIRFGDESTTTHKLAGAVDIWKMLQRPNHHFPCLELTGKVDRANDRAISAGDNSEELKRLNIEINETRAAIEAGNSRDGERSGNNADQTLLQEDLERLRHRVREITGADETKARADMPGRSAVANRIARFIEKLKGKMPTFASFLEEHIEPGSHCRYVPPPIEPPDFEF